MEAAIQATNEGIDGFLTKPFDNLELRATRGRRTLWKAKMLNANYRNFVKPVPYY